MHRILCKSKIHRARVTEVNINYEGSLTIDKSLMQAADLLPYEKVQVLNINNGTRAETYVLEGPVGSGQICVNGALARWAQIDDLLIIISYAAYEESEAAGFAPKVVLVDDANRQVGSK